MSTQSLLPDNRTTLERALEHTLSDHLLAIESPYPDLWNPENVPEHMLPYLAHAKGVTDWGGEINTAAKRQTVASIWPVQRLAGTAKGVADAVAGLGLQAEFIPGYTWGGPAYSFRVDLIGGLRGVSPERVAQKIEVAKAERDGFSIRTVYRPELPLFMGSAIHTVSNIVIGYQLPDQSPAPQTVFTGRAVHLSTHMTIDYQLPDQAPPQQMLSQGRVMHISRHTVIGRGS